MRVVLHAQNCVQNFAQNDVAIEVVDTINAYTGPISIKS